MAHHMRSGGMNGMSPQFQQHYRAALSSLNKAGRAAKQSFNQMVKEAAAKTGHTNEELSNRGLLLNEDDDEDAGAETNSDDTTNPPDS